MLYFDHCASTPPFDEVIQTVADVMRLHFANPSSIHSAGVSAEQLVHKSREVIAKALNVKSGEILFTSGATESNNLAVRGAALKHQGRGKHLITTQIEHPSVYECFRQLEREGFQVTYLPVNEQGCISVEQLQAALTDQTTLISIMHVNNEVGSFQPLAQIGEVLRDYPRILFHVDGVQGLGKVPLSIRDWGIDLLSISAHKIRGPKGVGFLYCREGIQLKPILAGGEQEHGLRAGTQNVPNIVAMAKAVRMTVEREPAAAAQLYKLRSHFLGLLAQIPELALNSPRNTEHAAPHIVNFSFPGMKPEVVIHKLEQHHIMASTQSACSSKQLKPSRVLSAMGLSQDRATSGIRISMAAEQTEQHLNELAAALQTIVRELKPLERWNR